ncbi:MAG: DUF3604 domain-containing protein, partial [Lysobacterales bacterium]
MSNKGTRLRAGVLAGILALGASGVQAEGGASKLFWGDTHLHTSYSPDAFLLRNATADPDTSYRWA